MLIKTSFRLHSCLYCCVFAHCLSWEFVSFCASELIFRKTCFPWEACLWGKSTVCLWNGFHVNFSSPCFAGSGDSEPTPGQNDFRVSVAHKWLSPLRCHILNPCRIFLVLHQNRMSQGLALGRILGWALQYTCSMCFQDLSYTNDTTPAPGF